MGKLIHIFWLNNLQTLKDRWGKTKHIYGLNCQKSNLDWRDIAQHIIWLNYRRSSRSKLELLPSTGKHTFYCIPQHSIRGTKGKP